MTGDASSSKPAATGAPEALGEEFLAAILEHLAHPIFVKDREFRWVFLNRAFCEMVGYPSADLLGRTDYDFFPRAEADFFREKDVELFATGSQVEIDEEPITDATGQRHVLATTKVPLRDASGQVTHLVGIIHDITRLKLAEDAMRQSHDALEQRVQERTSALEEAHDELVRKERLAILGQLAGGLAHQIRNPLGAITNAAYVLEKVLGRHPAPDAQRAIAILHEEAWHANRIITDLLEFARMRPAMPRAVDARVILEQSIEAQPLPEAIAVIRRFADPLPLASVDPEQVRDALDNLLRNAVEAMPGGGALTLHARAQGGFITIAVEDTGPGLPEEVRSRLFEPLQTTKPLGVGLGLPMTRALVENQGGTISYERNEPGGARFVVRLPEAAAGAEEES